MGARARDIEELEDLLNNAESDEKLCNQAIEIIERLVEEKKKAAYRGDDFLSQKIAEQEKDFVQVIRNIENRRHPHALDKFKEYCRKNS